MFKNVLIGLQNLKKEIIEQLTKETVETESMKGYEFLGRTVFIEEGKCGMTLNFINTNN